MKFLTDKVNVIICSCKKKNNFLDKKKQNDTYHAHLLLVPTVRYTTVHTTAKVVIMAYLVNDGGGFPDNTRSPVTISTLQKVFIILSVHGARTRTLSILHYNHV